MSNQALVFHINSGGRILYGMSGWYETFIPQRCNIEMTFIGKYQTFLTSNY